VSSPDYFFSIRESRSCPSSIARSTRVAGPPDGGMEGGTLRAPSGFRGFPPGGHRRRRLRREERGPRRGDAEEGRETPDAAAPRGGRLPFAVGGPFEATLPSLPAKVYETELQLRFGDTDAMGHVNNAKVVTYLELGRMRFFADVLGRSGWRTSGSSSPRSPAATDPHPASRSRLRPDAHHRRLPEFLPVSLRSVRSPGRPRFRRGGDCPGDVRLQDGTPCPMDADFLDRARDYIGGAERLDSAPCAPAGCAGRGRPERWSRRAAAERSAAYRARGTGRGTRAR